jgi:N-methylhydantoinase A/oxoprolinase/acetone carboxylase beta subunit
MREPLASSRSESPMIRIGVDVGGTFTDFVRIERDAIRVEKRLSSPDDPGRSVLEGVRLLDPGALAPVLHGTTVATNALLEGRGARTAFVTTRGFEDLLALGRGNRAELFRFEPSPRPCLVPVDEGFAFGVDERVGADGLPLRPLRDEDLEQLVKAIADAKVESVAVCLLFSYLYPEHERRVAAAIAELGRHAPMVSLSTQVLPEMREYERASTVAVNAYVMPIVAGYLGRLAQDLSPRSLSVMGSHGGLMSPETASNLAVGTVLSGPAAGVTGALAVARNAGYPRIISFDMGGTSTDVALCDDALPYTAWSEVGGYPVHLPSLDVHTVGAGGGSIVWADAGGGLRVGPRSAGADPGPAAYGRGGAEATLSDANILLGRRRPEA